MKHVLITGMSGTGKSTVIGQLVERGHVAIDLDGDEFSHWVSVDGDPTGANPGHDWMWREDKVAALLAEPLSHDLFVSGTAPNMGVFLPKFDRVILLTTSLDTMLQRLASRTNNPYGKRPEEVTQVKENLRLVEPRLRQIADHEIDTDQPLAQVVDRVVDLVAR
ncbi:MAG: AAA family ATPase [Pseudomonadales bacterium]|nr:AAA family ATPase [Pseudomonadales bacterium]